MGVHSQRGAVGQNDLDQANRLPVRLRHDVRGIRHRLVVSLRWAGLNHMDTRELPGRRRDGGRLRRKQSAAPQVKLARADAVSPGDVGRRYAGRQALRCNRLLLLARPAAAWLATGDDLDAWTASAPMSAHWCARRRLLRDQLVRGGFGFHEPREAQISTLLLCGTAATLT
jgi:hypothetical protein